MEEEEEEEEGLFKADALNKEEEQSRNGTDLAAKNDVFTVE
jgi:hypothetical protein